MHELLLGVAVVRLDVNRALEEKRFVQTVELIDARTHYDITADGRKILVRQPAGAPTPGIRLIVNWLDELNARTTSK